MSVSEIVSSAETMMDGDLARYLDVGRTAADAIADAIGTYRPRTILDLPCGHGRVARHLCDRYPNADLFVSDIDEAGVDFCVNSFGADKLPASGNFDDVDYGLNFDLIWVGSLITHLPQGTTEQFFHFLRRHLSSNGRAVITSHGAFVAGRLFMQSAGYYGLDIDTEQRILRDYHTIGYGYADYPHSPGYGISVIARHRIAEMAASAGLKRYSHKDHGWDQHQDVICLACD